MVPQTVLPFLYEEEKSASGMTALAGLPTYLEWAVVAARGGRHLSLPSRLRHSRQWLPARAVRRMRARSAPAVELLGEPASRYGSVAMSHTGKLAHRGCS